MYIIVNHAVEWLIIQYVPAVKIRWVKNMNESNESMG